MSSLTSHQRCIRLRAALQREVALRLRCRKPRALRTDRSAAALQYSAVLPEQQAPVATSNSPAFFA